MYFINGNNEFITKAKYRIKNWSLYNKSLINKGSINLWIDEKISNDWFYFSRTGKDNKKEGRSFIYSNITIELCLTARAIYKMPLRMTEGFLQSLFSKIN